MRDSDTYMMILEEGEEIRAKKDILSLGRKRFGMPDLLPLGDSSLSRIWLSSIESSIACLT